ncbi:hypothetical protein ACQY0O_005064 [Thecaphora frezii]
MAESPLSALERLPPELHLAICKLLDVGDLFRLRLTSKALAAATLSLSLWRYHAACLGTHIPLQPLPPTLANSTAAADASTTADTDLRLALEWSLWNASRIEQRWNTLGATPSTCYKTRAHIDRITCLKLVLGPLERAVEAKGKSRYRRKRYLLTGSVDGYVRVWDLSGPLPDVRAAMAGGEAEQVTFKRHPSLSRPTSAAPDAGGDSTVPGSRSSSSSSSSRSCAVIPVDAMLPPVTSMRHRQNDTRRRKLEHLVAEVDTGGDVTALDAVLSSDGSSVDIAVGSYYSAAGCLVYVLDLTNKPTVLDCRGALDPPQWCGTQCVSLLGDKVAVGTYTGLLHIFDWKTGWRGGIERSDRSSTAAVKLFPHHLLAVGRLGVVELFSLPTEQERESADDAYRQAPPSRSGHESAHSMLSLEDTLGSVAASSATSDATIASSHVEASSRSSFETQTSQQARNRPPALLARYPILEGNKPLLSVSFGEVRDTSLLLSPCSNDDIHAPLTLFVVDLGGLTHLEFQPLSRCDKQQQQQHDDEGFPYQFPPSIFSRECLAGERLIGAAAGASGRRGILMTSLGGVPPACSVRGYSSHRPPSPRQGGYGVDSERQPEGSRSSLLLPLCPTPNTSLPSPRGGASAGTGATTCPFTDVRTASGSNHLPRQAAAYGGSRADILTEVALDEESGLVCLATARGVVWIADYGQDPAGLRDSTGAGGDAQSENEAGI